MSWRLPHLAALVLAVGASGVASALEPEQFVAGWPLELEGSADFYELPLTLEVASVAQSLDQIAILDATGKPMPFYRVVPEAERAEQRVSLGASPLYRATQAEQIAQLKIEAGGRTRVSVSPPPGGSETEIVAFIVDAREVAWMPTAIGLYWRAQAQPFLIGVRVEHSEDLTNWRDVGRGSVATLAIDGASVEHREVPIRNAARGYYRITWDKGIGDWQLERVELVGSTLRQRVATREVELMPVAPPEDASVEHALYFDLGASMPVTAANLAFSGDNRWGYATIDHADSPEGPWRRGVGRHLYYRVALGAQSLESEPAATPRIEARYWRASFEAAPPDGTALELTYDEDPLRFAASGEAPYVLVAGTFVEEAGPDPTFSTVFSSLGRQTPTVGTVALGAKEELGGEAARRAPTVFPWRKVLLWTVLGLGVLLVAAMAVRVLRELKDET